MGMMAASWIMASWWAGSRSIKTVASGLADPADLLLGRRGRLAPGTGPGLITVDEPRRQADNLRLARRQGQQRLYRRRRGGSAGAGAGQASARRHGR